MSKSNIADESARARKLLAKNTAVRFQPDSVKLTKLSNVNPAIGEFASVCVVGSYGTTQYTICRPIGFTDLDAEDWIMIPTDLVPATLSRSRDLRADDRNKKIGAERLTILQAAGLVHTEEDTNGKTTTYYAKGDKEGRNSHLNQARAGLKADKKILMDKLKQLPKKDSGPAKQELNGRIQSLKLLDYMPENIRGLEMKIRSYISKTGIEEKLEKQFPVTHRTLTGPYGDQPQHAIVGARGYPLVDVLGALNHKMNEMDLSGFLGSKSSDGKPKGKTSKASRIYRRKAKKSAQELE